MFSYLYNVCLAYLYDVCSTVWCLLNCVISAQPYDVCPTVWCLLNCMMSAQLYDVCSTVQYVCSTVWCLPTCMTSALLDEVCFLLSCMISSYRYDVVLLYDVCLPVWCLLYWTMSSHLYDVYSSVWCLLSYAMSAQLCQVCLPGCLLYCMMSAYPYDFFFLYDFLPPVLFPPTCMMAALLFDVLSTCMMFTCTVRVFLPVYCIFTFKLSALLDDVFPAVWCLAILMVFYLYDVCSTEWRMLNCMMSAYLCEVSYLYDVCLPVWVSIQMCDVCLPG